MRKQAEKLVAASVVLALVVALGAHELSAQPGALNAPCCRRRTSRPRSRSSAGPG
jgi:hypothetical protein